MLFKTKGSKKYLNKLPLIVQAFLYNLSWKIVLLTMQLFVYGVISFYFIYHFIEWLVN